MCWTRTRTLLLAVSILLILPPVTSDAAFASAQDGGATGGTPAAPTALGSSNCPFDPAPPQAAPSPIATKTKRRVRVM